MVNTPMFVDDMMYTPYDQRSVDDIDDYKPPYNVRTRTSMRGAKRVTFVIIGNIACSSKWLMMYLIYSEGDFEVFRPAGAMHCTDQSEIWRGGVNLVHSSTPNFTPVGAGVGVRDHKTENFTEILPNFGI